MIVNNQYNNSISNNQDLNKESEDIDLSYLTNFLLRNKKIISITSSLFFLISIFSTFFVRKIWTGQFEIVLDNQNNSLPTIGSFSPNLSTGNKNIQTEIGILESPSVLMPIYDFVKKTKKQKDKNFKDITFINWKENQLQINLKKKTSILKISYFDNDKEIIIPALEKISLKYQDYSKRSTERSSQLSKIFLQNQVKKYREKSSLSYKAAQSFAIDQDMELFDLNTKANNESFINNQIIMPNISMEKVRVNSANRIRDIDAQIKKIEGLGNDSEQFQYIGSTIPSLVKEGLVQGLQELEGKIDDARARYRDEDLVIKNLVNKRYRLIKLIRKRAIGYLKAEKLTKEALMESAMRPKDVLLNYKALIREAKRDEITLIDLENKLRMAEIDNSRLKDPWELITIPTLKASAVYPSKKQFGFYGLIIGIIFGILFGYLKERKKDLIYERKILERSLSVITTEEININQISENPNKIAYLKEFLNLDDNEVTSLMPLGLIKDDSLRLLQKYLNTDKSKKSNLIIYSNNFTEFLKSKNKFLIANMKNIKYSDISDLRNYIKISNLEIKGIIIINEEIF